LRAAVYRFTPGRTPQGHEQRGNRYAIVVQARRFEHLSTWLIVPTSTSARQTSFRPAIEVPGRGEAVALCDALVSLDPSVRLGAHLGSLAYAEMEEIDAALRLLLDLDH